VPDSDQIVVVGAQEHNLKGIDVSIPRDRLVVVTGLSGSGKSSLAFDTIYQEGQRRFMESLSSYARQFLGSMEKPRVERVEGLSPTLCIDQKTVNRNPRSTVGTITEILDHLRLLMARLGTPRCPVCKDPIARASPGQIADQILRTSLDARLHVMAPIVRDRKGEYRKELAGALADGWLRARVDGVLYTLEDGIPELARYEKHTIELVVDRLRARPDDRARLVEAVERAVGMAEGRVSLLVDAPKSKATERSETQAAEAERHEPTYQLHNTDRSCPRHGISISEMEPRLFSFNAPQGMCTSCSGIGWTEDFDLDLLLDADAKIDRCLVPLQGDERLPFSSLSRGVVAKIAKKLGIPKKTLLRDLDAETRKRLLYGDPELRYEVTHEREGHRSVSERSWAGLVTSVGHVWRYTHLKRLGAYRRRQPCPDCDGARLNPVALAVDFRGQNIASLTAMTVAESGDFFRSVRLTKSEDLIGKPLVRELRSRLDFLLKVGLSYLSIDRPANTLSGGEAQRIRLAGQVGAGLQGVTYVLDEPSIGLHGRDQSRLLDALLRLRDHGNSVLVVEHDADTMARADYLIEIGPGAGVEGGSVVAAGTPAKFLRSAALTARFLRGEERIPVPTERRETDGPALWVRGASANNLDNVDLRVPLGALTVVTGVSGSGKSSLVQHTLARALATHLHAAESPHGPYVALEGVDQIDKIIEINQAPIGRTPRSNPATYTGTWTPIRELFAQLPEARARGFTKSRFSFNVKGGRCEECQGAGVRTVEMQFLADVQVPCESCAGARFNPETLEIRYRGRTIKDMLEMSITDAANFFRNHRRIRRILNMLVEVGLGYVALGQPSTTLSGGEAQRIKLASELARPATGRTLYILDEPTTGLHMADVRRLLDAVQKLVASGNTVLVIEHNTDVIKVADHVVDMGPDGGQGGGSIVGEGTPEHIATLDTPSGRVLRETLEHEARLDAKAAGLLAADGAAPVWRPRTSRRKRANHPAISLRGVDTHNLKHIDVDLPQGKMTVITGPSGSGKTSLAFDTLFAEGQRRYVESLSTYARRFLGRMGKAPLEKAEGLAPAIAIDQRNRGSNPRSTVATVTEIYDSLRLLYSRIGKAHCPECMRQLRAWSPSSAARHLRAEEPGTGWIVAALPPGTRAGDLVRDGFARYLDPSGKQRDLTELVTEKGEDDAVLDDCDLVVDRLNPAKADLPRIAEAVRVAFGYGGERARFVARKHGDVIALSSQARCPDHGRIHMGVPTPRHFSFNSHLGACADCGGLGRRTAVDEGLLLPEPDQPLAAALDSRVSGVLLRSPRSRAIMSALLARYDVPEDATVSSWPRSLRKAVLYGTAKKVSISFARSWGRTTSKINEERDWAGIVAIINGWTSKTAWLRKETSCATCGGGRLQPALLAVTLGDRPAPDAGPHDRDGPPGVGIADACRMTVRQAHEFWAELRLGPADAVIAEQVIQELQGKLGFLDDVGLGYLTLERPAETLSGGEAQRIRLATQLGSRLTGTIYVLDEPTIGLHPRDTEKLLVTLRGLRDLGNTLVVVEHDLDVMRAADHLIDMGPGAGEHGGHVMAAGTPTEVASGDSLTGLYLSGRLRLSLPAPRPTPAKWLTPPPARLHNLQDVKARFPRGRLTVVTGVSGSGKSSLVMEHLSPWLATRAPKPDPLRLVVIDQRPIGRTPRSTPATYCKIFGPIRTRFSEIPLARERGWGPGRFTFNGPASGRCTHCEGRGAVLIEMHFLSDIWMPCEHCGGRRFAPETLEVRWRGHSIADVLELTVDEACEVFQHQRSILRRLKGLSDVGLGYLRLGQAATTLSGGEAQRLKLATELVTRRKETVFLLDEPTTGLHLADIEKLLIVLHRLVDQGHTIVVIEHHMDIVRNADHVIDMGPGGGDEGGTIVGAGTPDALMGVEGSWTGRALSAGQPLAPGA
jgi:excinuclease ABC subunit A